MSEFEDIVKEYTGHALVQVRDSLGKEWAKLKPEHKASAQRSAERYIFLKAEEARGKDVADQLKFVETTITGFKLAGELHLYNAWWDGVNRAVALLGRFLASVGKGFLG